MEEQKKRHDRYPKCDSLNEGLNILLPNSFYSFLLLSNCEVLFLQLGEKLIHSRENDTEYFPKMTQNILPLSFSRNSEPNSSEYYSRNVIDIKVICDLQVLNIALFCFDILFLYTWIIWLQFTVLHIVYILIEFIVIH